MGPPVVEAITIRAEPEVVYDLICDVSRMGEWSPEATGARLASPCPGEGDRFIGTNRRGPIRWYTECTVRTARRGRCFAFDVDVGPVPLSRWCYALRAVADGTEVTETWIDRRTGLAGVPVRLAGQLLIPGSRANHNRAGMVQTLRRLKRALEG